MDKELIDKIIETKMERSNPQYTTPSGAFIELLRDLAREHKIKEISEALNIYCKEYHQAANFLRTRLPGILVNNYFTIREDLDYENFMKFSINDPDWADLIKEHAFSPENLVIEIESIITKSNEFKK